MLVRARINQLRTDTHRIARLAHAAFEDMANAQLLGDRGRAEFGFPKLKRGRARSHFEPVDVGEYVENFLRNAVREVALIALHREVRKGEYRDRCDRWRRRHRRSLCAGLGAMLAGSTNGALGRMLRPAVP